MAASPRTACGQPSFPDVGSGRRFVYYGETNGGRLLAAIVTERGLAIRVVTAYDLDAGQSRDYLKRRRMKSDEQEDT